MGVVKSVGREVDLSGFSAVVAEFLDAASRQGTSDKSLLRERGWSRAS
jgi:hypothetical protein